MENKPPLSPHIQIYRWHISSLVSITHRITGIINIIGITFICIWSCLLLLGENNYEAINLFLKSLFGKFRINHIINGTSKAPLIFKKIHFLVALIILNKIFS